jgi:hypothetical protein
MIRFAPLLLFFAFGLAQGQSKYKNVKIYESTNLSYQACEPSIAISKTNPDVIVAGAVLKYVYRSEDGGRTWTNKKMRSRHGVYGDPCIVSDIDGRFHYFHLSDPTGLGWGSPWILDRIVCQTSKSDGKRWARGSSIGLNRPKQQDKEWVTYDPVNDQLIATWTQFDKYGDESPSCESNILRSFSKNGKRWSEPVQLTTLPGNCVDNSSTAEGATSDVDEFGNIYTAWSLDGKIIMVKSTVDRNTGLVTSISEEIIAIDSGALWDFEIPGLGRANGMPILKCDRSGGPNTGTLYINWADQRNGTNNTDIWLCKSTDFAKTWSKPLKVNTDKGEAHQFFTWMDIDQLNGNLHFVFYDRRNHTDTMTDVYWAKTTNGGQSFTNTRISESPFDPVGARFFGDYNNINVFNGVIRPIWTRNERGIQSIWTALIDE